MFALTHCHIFNGKTWLNHHALVIEDNKISAILPIDQLASAIPQHNLQGAKVSAGFIDLQLNGCGGVMFNNDISLQTLQTMHDTNLKSGTTSFLPTLISSPDQDMQRAIHVTRQYMAQHTHQVLGLHLEGPYTNVKRKGIHPENQIRALEDTMVTLLCDNADVICKITLAPECNQRTVIQRLKTAGIIVSLGHTGATYDETNAGIEAGITFATHLYNAMTPTLNGREPGVVGAIYDHPSIYAGIIVDGFHVHYANVRLAHRVLGERLCLVTDATAAANAPADLSEFDFCGTTVYIKNGRCLDAKGTLGGSALTMIEGIRNLVEHVGISLESALNMASLYPARAIGVDDKLGSIAINKIANLVIFDDHYDVQGTVINGKLHY